MDYNFSTDQYLQIDADNYLQVFKRYPIVIDKGRGAKLWDTEGKEYIDFFWQG